MRRVGIGVKVVRIDLERDQVERIQRRWFDDWHVNHEFKGNIGNASFELDAKSVKQLSFADGRANISSSGEYSFSGWQPEKKILETRLPFGYIEIDWTKVRRLEKITPIGSTHNKKEGLNFKPELLLKMQGGPTLPLVDLQPMKNTTINQVFETNIYNRATAPHNLLRIVNHLKRLAVKLDECAFF